MKLSVCIIFRMSVRLSFRLLSVGEKQYIQETVLLIDLFNVYLSGKKVSKYYFDTFFPDKYTPRNTGKIYTQQNF